MSTDSSNPQNQQTSNAQRPFEVLGIQQIALGATELNPLRELWVDIFGLQKVSHFSSESENVVEDVLQLGQGPTAVEIDLMMPLNLDNKPRVDKVALNHFGLWVSDIHAAFDWLQQQGVRMAPGGIREGASSHDVCFIHPKGNEDFPHSGNGVLIELVQAPQEVIDHHARQ